MTLRPMPTNDELDGDLARARSCIEHASESEISAALSEVGSWRMGISADRSAWTTIDVQLVAAAIQNKRDRENIELARRNPPPLFGAESMERSGM